MLPQLCAGENGKFTKQLLFLDLFQEPAFTTKGSWNMTTNWNNAPCFLNKSTIEMGTFNNPCHKIRLYLIYIYIYHKWFLICVFFGSACFLDISFQKSSELPWQIICFVSLCQNDTVDGSEILQTRWGNGSLSVYPIILPRVFYTPRGFLAGVRKTIKQ